MKPATSISATRANQHRIGVVAVQHHHGARFCLAQGFGWIVLQAAARIRPVSRAILDLTLVSSHDPRQLRPHRHLPGRQRLAA
jgi:hypothetical protein